MELRNFITTTLVEIQTGVQEAIKLCTERGLNGAINPVWGSSSQVSSSDIREVSFDIAVTVNDKSTDKLGGGIRVMGVGFGADMSESAERSHVSRIQFTVPVIPPMTELKLPGWGESKK